MDSVKRDQYGVVWFGGGLMAASCYEEMRTENPALPKYEDLPPFDAHSQNAVGIDEVDE